MEAMQNSGAGRRGGWVEGLIKGPTGLDLDHTCRTGQDLLLAALVHNDQSIFSLLALQGGADHGLDRPRATPRGGRQSERDVVRSLHFFSQ